VRGDGVDEVVDGVLSVDDDERRVRVAPHDVVQRPRQRVQALLARVHGRHDLERLGHRLLSTATIIRPRSRRPARRRRRRTGALHGALERGWVNDARISTAGIDMGGGGGGRSCSLVTSCLLAPMHASDVGRADTCPRLWCAVAAPRGRAAADEALRVQACREPEYLTAQVYCSLTL